MFTTATAVLTPAKADFEQLVSANSNTSSTSVDIEEELAKIASSCLNSRDYELLTGNAVKHGVARIFGRILISETLDSIGEGFLTLSENSFSRSSRNFADSYIVGLRELRAVLKLPPPPPWKHYNRTAPSVHELASAPTVEEYYSLVEPHSKLRSLDSEYLFEHNVDAAVAFLDKRLPSIRAVFRETFEQSLPSSQAAIDRKTVDQSIETFHSTLTRMEAATRKMLSFGRETECYDT